MRRNVLKCGSVNFILYISTSSLSPFPVFLPSFSFVSFVRVSDMHDMDDLYQASPASFKSHSYAHINRSKVVSYDSVIIHTGEKIYFILFPLNIYKVLCFSYPIPWTETMNDVVRTHLLHRRMLNVFV